jgi:hypothetical protein
MALVESKEMCIYGMFKNYLGFIISKEGKTYDPKKI